MNASPVLLTHLSDVQEASVDLEARANTGCAEYVGNRREGDK